METNEFKITVDSLAQLSPARTLSTLPISDLQGKEFKFVKAIINRTFMTDEDYEALKANTDPVAKIEATTYIYTGGGINIGLRARSILGLRTMMKKAIKTTAAAEKALDDAEKNNKESDTYRTLAHHLLAEAEEANDENYQPSLPVSFKVLTARDVELNVNQVGAPEGTKAKMYPMQAYVKFQQELEARTKAAEEVRKTNPDAEPFNPSELFRDVSFRNSLRGTELVDGGVGLEPFKTVYIETPN